MVGMAVVQMANQMGVKTINVLREERPYYAQTVEMLKAMGADVVVPDSYLNTPVCALGLLINLVPNYIGACAQVFKEILDDLPPVRLGLNCIAGEQSLEMARALAYVLSRPL
jgi:NADPH:quinone reductase-like Zn-dependent oxidoreductase